MSFFGDVLPTIPLGVDGYDHEFCDSIWLIASVDTFQEIPRGRPVFLCLDGAGSYYWSFDLLDEAFAFTNLADAKAQLAEADRVTTLRLHILGLGDLLRYERAERNGEKFVPSLMSFPFFRYKNDPHLWSNKRGA